MHNKFAGANTKITDSLETSDSGMLSKSGIESVSSSKISIGKVVSLPDLPVFLNPLVSFSNERSIL